MIYHKKHSPPSCDLSYFDHPFTWCNCITPHCNCESIHSFVRSYQDVLKKVKPKVVWEWGPGRSTEIALASGACVISIETQRKFFNVLKHHPFLRAMLIPSSEQSYYRPGKADLYFIDGEAREKCVESVLDVMKDDSVICLHDAQRHRYEIALTKYPRVIFLTRGFAVASKMFDLRVL